LALMRGSAKQEKRLFTSKALTFEEQLAAAVELNCGDWLRLKGRLPWVELHDDPDVLWIFAGDTSPGNSATLVRFAPATTHKRISEILNHHRRHKAACTFILGPRSQPTDLTRHLKANGFSCRIHCAGMACDLNALGDVPALPKGVTIELVEAPPSLKPVTTERRRKRVEGRILMGKIRPRAVWHFSARVDGQPIGETTLLAGSQCAGIYDVEVIEKFRRRGVGSALIDAALRQAKKLDYRAAVLGATGAGWQLYSRLGFREVCKQSFWRYGKMRQL
jgi:GNAT superfamily N-acetyltransferase